MSITFENAAKNIALEQATRLHENNIAVIVNDGKDVTFEIETVSTSKERNEESDY